MRTSSEPRSAPVMWHCRAHACLSPAHACLRACSRVTPGQVPHTISRISGAAPHIGPRSFKGVTAGGAETGVQALAALAVQMQRQSELSLSDPHSDWGVCHSPISRATAYTHALGPKRGKHAVSPCDPSLCIVSDILILYTVYAVPAQRDEENLGSWQPASSRRTIRRTIW